MNILQKRCNSASYKILDTEFKLTSTLSSAKCSERVSLLSEGYLRFFRWRPNPGRFAVLLIESSTLIHSIVRIYFSSLFHASCLPIIWIFISERSCSSYTMTAEYVLINQTGFSQEWIKKIILEYAPILKIYSRTF